MLRQDEVIRLIFGFKLKYLRLQKGYSLQELSRLTGLSTSYLHDIERAKKYPKLNKINALAAAFEVSYDDLVSTQSSKRMQPIIDLLQSDFFKEFPLEEFGISPSKLFELFSNTPDRVNAFISTITKIARNYQLRNEHFYSAALRSFQDMYNNYFENLEVATQIFRRNLHLSADRIYDIETLEGLLRDEYQITVERTQLAQQAALQFHRSYFSTSKKTLYLNDKLSEPQERFSIGRELGFQYLKLQERSYLTRLGRINSFEELLNDFRASYFSAALLMEETQLKNDFQAFAQLPTWQPEALLKLMQQYQVTPEMFLQRLTNLFVKHFDLHDIFFIRMSARTALEHFDMTKELHLSRLHHPYTNEREEHYCRRWVSINILKKVATHDSSALLVDAQISKYWNTNNQYLCISIATPTFANTHDYSSVTVGFLINEKLRSLFHFLHDPNLSTHEVHTTCERCGIVNCNARKAPPQNMVRAQQLDAVKDAIQHLEQMEEVKVNA
ncbi:MAG: XRE family transcriptional regulator [Bacteroidota bacterium]